MRVKGFIYFLKIFTITLAELSPIASHELLVPKPFILEVTLKSVNVAPLVQVIITSSTVTDDWALEKTQYKK